MNSTTKTENACCQNEKVFCGGINTSTYIPGLLDNKKKVPIDSYGSIGLIDSENARSSSILSSFIL